MNNEEYNEKAQKLKVKIHELILSEYKYIDSRASFENMLKNRLTADEILRFAELFQGYMAYSDLITKDLEKYSSGKES